MFDMGFEPQVRDIVEEIQKGTLSEVPRQSMLFSTDFTDEVQAMARDCLVDYLHITVTTTR